MMVGCKHNETYRQAITYSIRPYQINLYFVCGGVGGKFSFGGNIQIIRAPDDKMDMEQIYIRDARPTTPRKRCAPH